MFPGTSTIFKAYHNHKSIVDKARAIFKTFGGVDVTLRSADGEKVRVIELEAKGFRSVMEEFLEYKEEDGKGYWALKAEHYELREGKLRSSQKGPQLFLQKLIDWRIPHQINETEEKYEIRFPAGDISLSSKRKQADTIILAHGSGLPSTAFKQLAFYYLLRGFDVVLLDFRGFGKRGGHLTDTKCKLDMDAVYQYLTEKKGKSPEHITAHGYCMGAAFAADLASRRAGVNLVLDRPFSEIREATKKSFLPRVIAQRVPRRIVEMDNRKALETVSGHVLTVYSEKDERISKEDTFSLCNSKSLKSMKSVSFVPSFTQGHEGFWLSEEKTVRCFETFLSKVT